MTNFENAIVCMINEDGLGEALYLNELDNEQRERFGKIKEIFLAECLRDCEF